MRVLAFATFLLLARSATSCDPLTENVENMVPDQDTYALDDQATVTCLTNYIYSWAASAADNSAVIKCGAGDSWAPEPLVDSFSGAVECVECNSAVSCTDGTCNAGVCECNDGYEKSDISDPRLCTLIQCPALTLTNQAADVTGPYDPTTAVTVTCSTGYFVEGAADKTDTVQTVTCNQGGAFDKDLAPCVACADGISDCTDGTCNAGVCECNDGYEKSDISDPRLCTLIQCPALTLTNQAADVTGPYDPTTTVTVTCSTGYFVEGADDDTVIEQTVTCNQGGAFNVILAPCVACADGISDCTDGTCNAGVCECNDGYEKSVISDPRLCTLIQCPALTGLTDQTVDVTGPYDYNTQVTVTCADGYYVGEVGTKDQTLTCASSGDLEPALEACVENPECDALTTDVNVVEMSPFSRDYTYSDGTKATITCSENYIISWATSMNDNEGNVECDAGSFVPDPVDGFAGTVGCVACIDTVDESKCEHGTCTDGVCVCEANHKKSLVDPRLCTIIQCNAFVLSNQVASADGPYDVNAVVTVTCTDGYHVSGGSNDVDVQTLTCDNTGYFDETLKSCIVCADDSDCTDGTCNNNNICECDATRGFKLKEDDLNVCEEVTCPDDYCSYGGKCSVKELELECDCPLGTQGDTCAEFTSDPCLPDPCKNDATCSRVMTDRTDFTKHACTCTDDFNGDSCEFANNFHVGVGEKGIEIIDTNVNSVEFGVVTASGVGAMYIALLTVVEMDGKEHKVLLLKSDESTLTLNVIDKESVKIEGLTLDGTSVTAKIHVNSGNKLQLDVADMSVSTDLTVSFIKLLAMGGTGCAWNDASCSFGTSRIFYHSFVGYFGVISIDGDKKTFEDISSISANKAVASVFDCDTFTCGNSGTCDSASGQITCSCPAGFTGFDCGTFNGGVSFNGYTSDFIFGATTVPIIEGDQTLSIDFDKSTEEIGEMANIKVGDCNIVLKAAGGTSYKVGDTEVIIEGSTITMTLDGADVKIGGDVVMSCALTKTDLSAEVTASLGGIDSVDGSVTLQDSRYKGCISKITVNGMDIMQITDGNVNNNADTTQCISSLNPEDPCEGNSNPCLNNGECSIEPADYSATCACTNVPYTVGETCTRQAFCTSGHTCTENGTCTELDSITDCEAAKETKEELACGEGDRWYYYCSCNEGWQGDNCDVEIVTPPEPVKDNNDTTTIIVVVVVVAVVLGVVATIIIVKKRRSGAGNGTTNGKTEGTYSPQAQEKDLEMSGKIDEGAEDPKNLYDDIDVIKNPNAESES
ncbi:fibropellin-1-like isoform X2 [Bolinopsis microptera]|uniref:fibropellin-1-like isoform X2 n=1 Tax=Bolinopsis microptera TaxID=2820187 RepID=UPI0030792CE4